METNLAYEWERDPGLTESGEGWKRELLDGQIYLMSPGTEIHSSVAGNLYFLFQSYLRGKPCRVYMEGPEVHLSDRDYVFPDVMILCDRNKIRNNRVYGGPDLVAEILSPSTARKDRGIKMKRYAAAGVREYWLVSPREKTVERYLLEDGELKFHDLHAVIPETERMQPEERLRAEAPFHCSLFPDLEIHMEDIFYDLIEP